MFTIATYHHHITIAFTFTFTFTYTFTIIITINFTITVIFIINITIIITNRKSTLPLPVLIKFSSYIFAIRSDSLLNYHHIHECWFYQKYYERKVAITYLLKYKTNTQTIHKWHGCNKQQLTLLMLQIAQREMLQLLCLIWVKTLSVVYFLPGASNCLHLVSVLPVCFRCNVCKSFRILLTASLYPASYPQPLWVISFLVTLVISTDISNCVDFDLN